MMKNAFALMMVAGLAGTAMASSSTTSFTSYGTASFTNKASMNGLNDVANISAVWSATGGGTVNAIRVTGNLADGGLGTYASEARVRMTPGAGNSFTGFNLGAATSVQTFTTLAVGPTQLSVTPFTLAAGDVNFQWYESFNDGAGADSTWTDVSYEFGFGGTTITNGNIALGAVSGVSNYSGSHVSGGLDFVTFSVPAVVNPGDSLTIAMTAGLTGTAMSDTEIALYDSLGNKIAENDDTTPSNFFSTLVFNDLTPLAGGSYTLVTGGYNTVFPTTLSGTFAPGTNAGSYELALTYVPAPGAMALLGLGGLVATRRRR